ncbi:MAG: EamA family transporter [Spirochaetales bacterium]|nr:EamA family transporter [Spirochaetales bacterium]
MTLKGAILLLCTVSFTVTGQILMKKGININPNLNIKSFFTSPHLLLGGLCYVSGFVIWLNVLKVLPLSIAYPSSSISFILIILASSIFLGEAISLFKIIGVLCICTGVFFIAKA